MKRKNKVSKATKRKVKRKVLMKIVGTVKRGRGRPKKDIVKELLVKPVVDDFSTEKVTNAWGECIPVQKHDIEEELGFMEGFKTYERYEY